MNEFWSPYSPTDFRARFPTPAPRLGPGLPTATRETGALYTGPPRRARASLCGGRGSGPAGRSAGSQRRPSWRPGSAGPLLPPPHPIAFPVAARHLPSFGRLARSCARPALERRLGPPPVPAATTVGGCSGSRVGGGSVVRSAPSQPPARSARPAQPSPAPPAAAALLPALLPSLPAPTRCLSPPRMSLLLLPPPLSARRAGARRRRKTQAAGHH
ncbi:chromobox protein homolog 3 isoform X1 [Empidonax traillii]|uniref:chromobox protein homolog 3 isoform X1 n=1 Tax=Empidonax traillii TaxID=164674 RepID=UPI000FFD8D13|nr:chromobox protein homolog 3 isoform X1 [Empidonax traillii]